MQNDVEMKVPDRYKKTISVEKSGKMVEVLYPTNHYINHNRQLIASQKIAEEFAGRTVVEGEAITKKCNVYLPAGYDEADVNKKYNVIYFLHGVGGNHFEWMLDKNEQGVPVICSILDHLTENGETEPMIVVFPEGRSAINWENCEFDPESTSMLGFYYFDYELRFDLIPFIESQFHTYADINQTSASAKEYNRLHRAIAGLSMGGMQSLNLTFGGYRCDSAFLCGAISPWNNGLVETVRTPGMEDLFSFVGAFSNAPTTSKGEILGEGIRTSGYTMSVLHIICGDSDGIAYEMGYQKAINGLMKEAGDAVKLYSPAIIKGGKHDFGVWNYGAYQFLKQIFRNEEK